MLSISNGSQKGERRTSSIHNGKQLFGYSGPRRVRHRFDRAGGTPLPLMNRGVERPVTLYRVHFRWRNKEVQLVAESLDLTHPYFVSIKGIVFKENEKLIINPSEEEIRRTFGDASHLMIPFQTVSLIEEFAADSGSRIRPFTLVEEPTAEVDEQSDGGGEQSL